MQDIDYADMLEIPVNTVNVTKKKSKKKKEETELKEQVLEAVNERVEGVLMDSIVTYGDETENTTESIEGGNSIPPSVVADSKLKKDKNGSNGFKKFFNSKILIAEFVIICVLVGTIFLTNVFYQNSAINTFFSNMFGNTPTQAQAVDDRNYKQLTVSGIVKDSTITCSITNNSVLTVQAKCSIYTPHNGKITKVEKASDGSFAMEVEHTTKFKTVFKGLTYAYGNVGDTVFTTIPIGYSDGSRVVQATMFDGDSVISASAFEVGANNNIVWK